MNQAKIDCRVLSRRALPRLRGYSAPNTRWMNTFGTSVMSDTRNTSTRIPITVRHKQLDKLHGKISAEQ